MSAILSRLKPVLMAVCVLTGIVIITGLTLRFASPAISLQHSLYQVRYGLLAWRLSLYIAGVIFVFPCIVACLRSTGHGWFVLQAGCWFCWWSVKPAI